MSLANQHLVLFFTQGLSLASWERGGLLEREVALYRALRPLLGGITFVTYGGPEELEFAECLPGIDLVCNHRRWSQNWYRRALRWVPPKALRRGTVFRCNQARGGELGLQLAQVRRVPFVARFGYLYSTVARARHGDGTPQLEAAMGLERRLVTGAWRVVVTTPAMAGWMRQAYDVPDERLRVIPNYVETDLFCPQPGGETARRVLFVGRLEWEKNLLALIQGLAGLEAELWLVGEGSERARLADEGARLGVTVQFLGARPHRELPALINQAALFVMPSFYEGHPKALLEAMACGAAVLGSDVGGIREVVRHNETGWLSGVEAAALGEAVRTLLGDAPLRARLGRAARVWVEESITLPLTVEREVALLGELTQGGGHG